jgi:hypothetical protein
LEFLQQTWMLGPDFHSLVDDSDFLLGQPAASARGMSIPTPSGSIHLKGMRE